MTSQEPPLTRREARERERLREAQSASSTPETTADASPAASSPAAPFPASSAFAPPAQQPVPVAQPVPSAPAAAPAVRPAPPTPAPFQPAPQAAPRTAAAPQPVAPPQPAVSPQPAAAAQAPAAQQAAVPQAAGRTPERTLTRRELRAMLGVSQLDDEDLDEGIDDPATASQVPAQQRPVAAPPVVQAPVSAASPEASVAPQRKQPTPPPVAAPAVNTGHWSQQLEAEDDHAEPFDQLLSRGGVSRGVPTTTNALILPVLPDDGKIVSPIAGGDEVIVTGSIDLPRSYGSTGVHPSQVDSTDIDRLFDNVEDAATTGVAPVAATKAISTQHAATKQMMAPPKKDGPNVPLVLAVTAGVLALGVVATLIIGAVFNLF